MELSLRKSQALVDGRISLEHHPGRLKPFDAVVRLADCQLLDEHQQPTSSFMAGREARIRIGYRMTTPLAAGSVSFVCVFRNDQGQRLAYCSSDIVGDPIPQLHPSGSVECVIPKLPLAPGLYAIDLGCKVSNAWADFIYEAVEIEVVDGGFYVTRRLPPEGEGQVLLEYTWRTIEDGH